MKTTGQILKAAREKKGVSIAEVSLATKINTKVISAMEEGNMAKLPPKTFLRGFVQSYAIFLQLDANEIMARFHEEVGSPKAETQLTPEKDDAATENSKTRSLDPIAPNNLAKIGAVIGIFILIGLIVLLKNKMESYQHESVAPNPVTVTGLPANSPSASPIAGGANALIDLTAASPSATAAPMSSLTSSPTPPPTVAPTPTTQAQVTPVPATPAPPTPKPTPKPTATAKPSPTPNESATPSSTPTPAEKKGKPQDIVLEALDTVSIDAQIDDEPVKKIQLKPDQIENIKAKRKVILKLSDGGAVNIIVNGNDRGVPGDLGKPKKVELP